MTLTLLWSCGFLMLCMIAFASEAREVLVTCDTEVTIGANKGQARRFVVAFDDERRNLRVDGNDHRVIEFVSEKIWGERTDVSLRPQLPAGLFEYQSVILNRLDGDLTVITSPSDAKGSRFDVSRESPEVQQRVTAIVRVYNGSCKPASRAF